MRWEVRGKVKDTGLGHITFENKESAVSVALEEGEVFADTATPKTSRSLSECYFAGKGRALFLPSNDRLNTNRRVSVSSGCCNSDIQQHLQSMFYLLRPDETLKMAVKLESVHAARTRYLVVVSCVGKQDAEESCLLGIDCNERTTVGLVLRVLADTAITLDGDGGFSVSVCGQQHIFKPVSVQAMWSALQTLHKVSSKAREHNYFLGGLSHEWVHYYEQRIESDRSCLNEWHAMDDLESRRPPSPDSVRHKPVERGETERTIRTTLKEIMMSVDLDEVTSKYIRGRLEEELDMDLNEYKPFIDQEMLTILGQMDSATEVFDHVYLGSEWNASNFEELQRNGVGHILNVTREIDNFFPGMFDYLNIRVYDDEKTDLLRHWDNTFKYISRARKDGSKVLVHCKMGVSRSASVVIAYAMKAYNWDFKRAMEYVKEKRTCIKPNSNFLAQLETYQGILEAMKNKEKLQKSKSETNLESSELTTCNKQVSEDQKGDEVQSDDWVRLSGKCLAELGSRPKSWSPSSNSENNAFSCIEISHTSISLEQLNLVGTLDKKSTSDTAIAEVFNPNLNVRMPYGNGDAYSVSQNKVMYLPPCSVKEHTADAGLNEDMSECKDCNVECSASEATCCEELSETSEQEPIITQTKHIPQMLTAVLVKKEIWDPGDPKCKSVVWTAGSEVRRSSDTTYVSELKVDLPEVNVKNNVISEINVRNRTLPRREGDPFSAQVDRVFEREERKQVRTVVPVTNVPPCIAELCSETPCRDSPSRQSSWSSYDSAVVLSYQGESRDAPSRQSSWGSGDTRWNGGGTLPSRNSSWGSYDMRPSMQYVNERGEKEVEGSSGLFPYDKDEIPWHPGTVKRTKQKLEEESSTVKRVCQDSHSNSPPHYASSPTLSTPELVSHPLSTAMSQPNIILDSAISSASEVVTSPCIISSPQCASVKHHKEVLENLTNKNDGTGSVTGSEEVTKDVENTLSKTECERSTSGIVKNLKKEFEARSFFNKSDKSSGDECMYKTDSGIPKTKKKVRSLPSSPVSVHHPETRSPGSSEDLSVRTLVGRYEISSRHRGVSENESISRPNFSRTHSRKASLDTPSPTCRLPSAEVSKNLQPKNNVNNKISSLQQHTAYNPTPFIMHEPRNGESRRPPVPHVRAIVGPTPSAVVASVVAKAASKKQQQGKTHPLARLTINRAVY